MLWLACFTALLTVALLGVLLWRRRPRDADLIMRRERAMVALADINRDQVIPPPADVHAEDRASGHVTIVDAESVHPSLRHQHGGKDRSHRPARRQPFDLTNRPTVAHLPSVPGQQN
jgi:hypothetical protein